MRRADHRLHREPGAVGVAVAVVARVTEVGRALVDGLQEGGPPAPHLDVEGDPVGLGLVDVAVQAAVDRVTDDVQAVDDQLKRIVADQLSFTLGCDIKVALAAPSALKSALARYYGVGEPDDVGKKLGGDDGRRTLRLDARSYSA